MTQKKHSYLLLGHRGFRAKYPENTALSFDKALEHNAAGFECDIQRTSDGHFVIIHDARIDRTARNGKKGRVSRMTLSELKAADFGDKEHILTLQELLNRYKTCFINLELKEETLRPKHCGDLISIIKKHGDISRILISSFRHDLLPAFKEAGFATGMLLKTHDIIMHPLGTYKRIIEEKHDYINFPITAFRFPWRIYTAPIVHGIVSLGYKTVFWTVNSKSDFAFAGKYADVIISDHVK